MPPTPDTEFQQLVDAHYRGLWQFALSLAKNEPDAGDLVQDTFLRWAQKSDQVRDPSRIKSWLFTTLYRLFLNRRRRAVRFPHESIEDNANALPPVQSDALRKMEAADVLTALQQLDETFRSPLMLFYLEDHSYQEIADILGVPIGTVMSRLWRGKTMLREALTARERKPAVPPVISRNRP